MVAAAQTPEQTDLCYKTVDVEKVRALEFLQHTVCWSAPGKHQVSSSLNECWISADLLGGRDGMREPN